MFPVKFTLGMGQLNLVILLLICLFFYFWEKNHLISSLSLAIVLLLKLFPLLFLPYLVLQKKWKVLMLIAAASSLLIFCSLLLTDSSLWAYFVQHVVPGLLHASPSDYYNQALSGFLVRSLGRTEFFQLIKLGLSAIFLCVTFAVLYVRRDVATLNYLGYTALLSLALLIHAFSWQHHFVLLIPVFIFMYAYIVRRKLPFRYLFLLGLSYLLVSINLAHPESVPLLLQSHVFYATVLLWGLNIGLLLKYE